MKSLASIKTRVSLWSLRREVYSIKVSDRAAGRKPEPTPRRLLHTVRRGESLFSIAKRYKVSVDKLRQWNSLSKGKPIQPGDTLTVHAALPGDSI